MPVNIFDANSWLRRTFETDTSGLAFRNIYDAAQHSLDVNIYVWDGAGGNDARRAIYPAYKSNRKPAGENIYAALDHARALLKHTPAIQVTVRGYEADDVIAHLARKLGPNHGVKIWSTDGDLNALCTTPGVSCSREPPHGLAPEHIQLYKICVGDPSDSVAGIKGFGEKAWAAVENKHRLRNLVFDLDVREEDFAGTGISKAVMNWMLSHRSEIDALIEVIQFRKMPDALVASNMQAGTRDAAAAEGVLRACLM